MTPDPFIALAQTLEKAGTEAGGPFRVAIDSFPYGRFLGLMAELDPARIDEIVIRAPFRPGFIGAPGRFHGGVLGAVLEIAGMSAWIWQAGRRDGIFPAALPRPITLTVDYLRPAGEHDLFATARLMRWGRRVVVAAAEAWQEDRARPAASAIIHFLLPQTDRS